MVFSYDSSNAVKIDEEMRNSLNIYNQRRKGIDEYSRLIDDYRNDLSLKQGLLHDLDSDLNGDDRKLAREANRKIKGLQKDIDKLLIDIADIEGKRDILLKRQNASFTPGASTKSFDFTCKYNEDESFDLKESKLSIDDLDAIWEKLSPDKVLPTKNEADVSIFTDDPDASVYNVVHDEVERDLPKIEVSLPMDSSVKLKSIYDENDVVPRDFDKLSERDINDLTLFVDYNDYIFTFALQFYGKNALTFEDFEKVKDEKGCLSFDDFNRKRTSQISKIVKENKRLNKKIVSLGKDFTKTVDKLSKEYSKTTDELSNQVQKAKEQIEVDRVEKVQTKKFNESLTENIRELEKQLKEKEEKIKVFEEKLNTVLGIVKGVKKDKDDIE